jgi:GNAT superfamily N-acetyltransferase
VSLRLIVFYFFVNAELDFLAVGPKHQRRGIGRQLLNWGVYRAKEQSKDCYVVATDAGLPLYKAGGLEEIGRLDVFGEAHTQMIIKNDPKWNTTEVCGS